MAKTNHSVFASTARRVFLAHLPADIRGDLETALHTALKPTGANLVCLHDNLASVLEEPRENLFAAARAACEEAPVHALILGAADTTEEFAVLELVSLLRCPLFILPGNDDEWVAARFQRFKWARLYAHDDHARLVADLTDYLVNDFAPLPPAPRVLLAHLEPEARQSLMVTLARLPSADRIEFLHDSTSARLDPSDRKFFNTTVKFARSGPPHLIVIGAGLHDADEAVRHLRTIFNCPIAVLLSVRSLATERRLRMIGADEVFPIIDLEAFYEWVSVGLAKLNGTS